MRTKSDILAELDRLEQLRVAGNAAIDAAYSWGLFVGAGGMLALISFLFIVF